MNRFDRYLEALGTSTFDLIQSVNSRILIEDSNELSNDQEILFETCDELGLNSDQLVKLFAMRLYL